MVAGRSDSDGVGRDEGDRGEGDVVDGEWHCRRYLRITVYCSWMTTLNSGPAGCFLTRPQLFSPLFLNCPPDGFGFFSSALYTNIHYTLKIYLTLTPSHLSSKRDCTPKRVKLATLSHGKYVPSVNLTRYCR